MEKEPLQRKPSSMGSSPSGTTEELIFATKEFPLSLMAKTS